MVHQPRFGHRYGSSINLSRGNHRSLDLDGTVLVTTVSFVTLRRLLLTINGETVRC